MYVLGNVNISVVNKQTNSHFPRRAHTHDRSLLSQSLLATHGRVKPSSAVHVRHCEPNYGSVEFHGPYATQCPEPTHTCLSCIAVVEMHSFPLKGGGGGNQTKQNKECTSRDN